MKRTCPTCQHRRESAPNRGQLAGLALLVDLLARRPDLADVAQAERGRLTVSAV